MNRLRLPLMAMLAFCLLVGCGSLDKTGVYQGDKFLYDSELAITTSYDVIHAYVTWEKNNRAALVKYPEITKSADVMRLKAKQWFATANALHDAYKADPSAANKTAFQTILDELRAAITEATGYMLKTTKPT